MSRDSVYLFLKSPSKAVKKYLEINFLEKVQETHENTLQILASLLLKCKYSEGVARACSAMRCFKSFAKFIGKHLAYNFIKKEIMAQVFTCEFYKIFKNIFFGRRPTGDCFSYFNQKHLTWKLNNFSTQQKTSQNQNIS